MSADNKTIVLGIQQNYKIAAAVLIKSLIKNNQNSIFDIFILTDADLSEYFNKLHLPNCTINIKVIDISEIKNIDCGRFGLGTLYRLLMDQYIPTNLDKVLYLDSDIIVNGSIDDLFGIEFNEHELVAAVECSISKEHIKKIKVKSNKIFNAGVILFSFNRACNAEVFSQARDYVIENNTSFNDQDALNTVLDGRVKYISPKWNYELFRAKRDLIYNKVDASKINMIHYTGKDKPWDYYDINPYSYLYRFYYKELFGEPMKFNNVSPFARLIKTLKLYLYKNFLTSRMYILLQNIFRTRA